MDYLEASKKHKADLLGVWRFYFCVFLSQHLFSSLDWLTQLRIVENEVAQIILAIIPCRSIFPSSLEQNRSSIEVVCGIGYCIKQHCMMIILYQREIRRPPKPKPRPPPPPSSNQAFFFGLSFFWLLSLPSNDYRRLTDCSVLYYWLEIYQAMLW